MKRKIAIPIIILITILICSSYAYHLKIKENSKKDIPIVTEYIYDILSLSRIDINNYSINTNFEKEYSLLNNEDIWKKSMTYKYMQENKQSYNLNKSMELSTIISTNIKEIHLKNIEFIKTNIIPLNNLEGTNSNTELEKYLSKIEKNKKEYLDSIDLLQNEIRLNISQYINYLNKHGNDILLEEEEKKFNDYFSSEYKELLNKQINSKIESLIK